MSLIRPHLIEQQVERKGSAEDALVAPFYETPFEFTGTIHSVTFDDSGDVIEDSEAEMRVIMARQ